MLGDIPAECYASPLRGLVGITKRPPVDSVLRKKASHSFCWQSCMSGVFFTHFSKSSRNDFEQSEAGLNFLFTDFPISCENIVHHSQNVRIQRKSGDRLEGSAAD